MNELYIIYKLHEMLTPLLKDIAKDKEVHDLVMNNEVASNTHYYDILTLRKLYYDLYLNDNDRMELVYRKLIDYNVFDNYPILYDSKISLVSFYMTCLCIYYNENMIYDHPPVIYELESTLF